MHRTIRAYLVLLFVYFAPNVNAQPVPCAASDGRGMAACVEAAYPAKLAAGVAASERIANMAFLRDRLIETARCAGLDVGLNLKRGGPSISMDFVAWKHDGITDGVDIGAAYDDTTKPLKLMWHTYGPPNYGFPTFKAYGPVSCVIAPPEPPSTDPPPFVDVSAILRQIEELRTQIGQLGTQLGQEREARQQAEEGLQTAQEALTALVKAITVPTVCAARGPWGIPVRCEIR